MFRRLDPRSSETVEITLDGEALTVPANISVAAAMLLAGATPTRTTPVGDNLRAPFCMMGVCFDCLMEIDSRPNQRACLVTVREGMCVSRQREAVIPGVEQ